mmetsp:Transcript_46934/g.75133  ORF Transcript_46934/g.75133 Transcript_46934/m.75133 type:complete len:241 (+) Transcript_46934:20-742(+)
MSLDTSTSSVVLYSYWRSSCSWRVRIALNLKNIKYQYVAVNLKEGGQYDSGYKSKNSMQQVPTLLIDGQTLTQSVAIMEYLEESRRYSGRRLLPDNPKSRAVVRMITEIINSGIQPVQNFSVMKRIVGIRKEYDSKIDGEQTLKYFAKWGKDTIEPGFVALESLLSRLNNGKGFQYCTDNNNVTMADICLVPQVYNAMRFNVDMSRFPTIQRVYDNCMKLQAFQDSHPSKMVDAPPPSKL